MPTTLTNCRLIDGTGRNPTPNSTVVITDGVITVAGPDAAGDQGETVLDMQGWTVMPGLMNMHVHLGLNWDRTGVQRASRSALRCARKAIDILNAGVTTVRSVGDPELCAIDVRDAVNAGLLPGARVFAAGQLLHATGSRALVGSDGVEVDGADGFRKAARERMKQGADLIKICFTGSIGAPDERVDTPQVTREELAAAVAIAHDYGKHLCVHAGGSHPIQTAIEVGVDCIEHGYVFDQATAELMARNGTFLVPTLCVTHGLDYMRERGCPDYMLDKTAQARDPHVQSIRAAYRAGVRICNGTDMLPDDAIAGTIATVHECELMVDALGMTPMEAIIASTSVPADLLGIRDWVGTLTAGMAADLIAMPGRPDRDIGDLRTIGFVMKEGRVIRSELPGFLRPPLLG